VHENDPDGFYGVKIIRNSRSR